MEEDFDAWYRRTYGRACAVLVTISQGDVDRATEACDEAFVRAFERWGRVRQMAAPDAWVITTAVNRLRRQHRRSALEGRLLRRARPIPADPTAVALAQLERAFVWEAVAALPARQREAVALRYVADLPETEVARTMGIARGTVASLLSEARRCLGPVGVVERGAGDG